MTTNTPAEVRKPFFRHGIRTIMTDEGKQVQRDMLLRPYMIHYQPTPKRHSKKTFAVNFDTEGRIYIGAARCSKKDQFSKKLGSTIASGRLEKALTTDHVYFTVAYFNTLQDLKKDRKDAIAISIPLEIVDYIAKIQQSFLGFVADKIV